MGEALLEGDGSGNRARCWRKFLQLAALYFVLVAIAAGLYLLSPSPQSAEHLCGETVRLGRMLSFPLNCDSFEFIDDAIDPAILLHPRSIRQARPVFVITAALLTRGLIACRFQRLIPGRTYVAIAATPKFQRHYEKHHLSVDPNSYPSYALCAYVSYVLINGILLLATLILFHWLAVEDLSPNLMVVAFASLLLANDVVKVFFWTPHTQFFNLVVPLGCVLICQELLRYPCRRTVSVGCFGLVTGVLSLAYGSFAIWVLGGVAALALSLGVAQPRLAFRGFMQRSGALAVGFAIPPLAWVAICKLVAGSYYNHEIGSYHQFVWVLEAVHLGWRQFSLSLTSKLIEFLIVLWPVSRFPVLLLGAVAIIGLASRAPLHQIVGERSSTFAAIAVTTGACLLFFYLMGFYQERLGLNVQVPLLLAATVLAIGIAERGEARLPLPIAGMAAWALAVVRLVYEVAKSGPWD